jgi:hypothetical protein
MVGGGNITIHNMLIRYPGNRGTGDTIFKNEFETGYTLLKVLSGVWLLATLIDKLSSEVLLPGLAHCQPIKRPAGLFSTRTTCTGTLGKRSR